MFFSFRKQLLGSGETIQSYSGIKHERTSSPGEEENIDVVNDTDKDLGKYLHFLFYAPPSSLGSDKIAKFWHELL